MGHPVYYPEQTQVQVDHIPQHKNRYILIEERVGNSLEQIDTDDDFLNRKPVVKDVL